MSASSENSNCILIVDDEEIIRDSFSAFLSDYGYRVLGAENGRLGLEIFEQQSPDAVILDLRMPEMDGLEVLETLKQKSPDTPVLVISGGASINDAVAALRLGAWDYILKPLKSLDILVI